MITAPHLHAMVIHFPIALLMIGFLSEIIAVFSKWQFFKNVSFYLLSIGALGAIAAYISGSYAGDGMTDGLLQEPLGMHKEAALVTLSLSILTVLTKAAIYFLNYQKNWAKWASFLLFSLLVGSVTRTAFLGGELVFKHGAGIELALPDFGTKPSE
ncbi:DUF2231 domain-containing protein [Lacihabitans sp. LS3-19]|uniref:DUF2231 domain-containing protein n=1 Tax=Lacihabitans sp. LS3-19 TaxID=2487335 RepID=UPI0020CB9FCF|nr:DUF2231 domain-containing protein [Lacihabitans sp. LS3-19]MCP9768728.1 DUF2231 domain-containing protein [Lacihabitans sp. LS3-19]